MVKAKATKRHLLTLKLNTPLIEQSYPINITLAVIVVVVGKLLNERAVNK